MIAKKASSILSLASSPELLVVGLRNAVNIYNPRTGNLLKTLAKPGIIGLWAPAQKCFESSPAGFMPTGPGVVMNCR